jgi:hypothetical protein
MRDGAPAQHRSDLSILWSMISWMSGGAAFGGAIAPAVHVHASGAQLVRAALIALVVAIAALWFVWTIGQRLLLGVLRRAALPSEISTTDSRTP